MKRYPRDNNQSTGKEVFFEAPLRGLRTDSSLLGLAPEYAYELVNMVVQPDALVSRKGCEEFALIPQGESSFWGARTTLMVYSNTLASRLFFQNPYGIVEVTAGGIFPSYDVTVMGGEAVWTNFATSGGQFLYTVNGADAPLMFNGTIWQTMGGASSPILGGTTLTDLVSVLGYRNRLFFLSKNFLGFYYLPVDSVGGTLTAFSIGSVFPRGGSAVAQATWTVDGGNGQDDFYVIASSEGEVAVFFGNDPGNLAAWDLRGVYYLGKPLGKYPFLKFGGDLLYLSESGIIPLSRALVAATVTQEQYLTKNISPSWFEEVRNFRGAFGWQMHIVPDMNLLIVNTPKRQFVYNFLSRAWSEFSGWPAQNWCQFGNNSYFSENREGVGLRVMRAFSSYADDGDFIRWKCRTAFSRFKSIRALRPILARPFVAQNVIAPYTFGFAHDFEPEYESIVVSSNSDVGGSLWDSALWNVALWGGTPALQREWHSVDSPGGLAISIEIAGASISAATIYLGADVKLSNHGLVF